MLSRLYGGPRPAGGGFETFSWYYFRISGVVLIFLVIIHLTIMHVTNDVSCTTYAFVAARYANPFWRLFDWLLLTFGLTHGVNGLRVVIDDYVRSPGTRLVLQGIAAVLLLAFFMLGTITLITFQPVAGSLGPACLH
ncbi:succinate dehydrogenase, hydrophobic membrane anchor protein [Ktedonobacter racemifer]|jgi:succinate dehydrogenase / fumarate reductase membrane anchor subunit|uniref:Succinate dehydrogenase hydrophobic membrane anchor subunit n=1 Tax=Ktedonobacter racemifer DSM 44963 TaxID=485913 RepID=D6TP44_KTERA|nr:succinate dehydrogenase, hydrophobic membrane anchor protein [Ktedonobacter racemifer]EFH87400.1 succinate dehydrogenase, hydrophobic membrane anchor protein [Ktedonobacter racemifer DSM 44963]